MQELKSGHQYVLIKRLWNSIYCYSCFHFPFSLSSVTMSETVRWHPRYVCMTYVRSWSTTPGYLTLYIFMYVNNTPKNIYIFPTKSFAVWLKARWIPSHSKSGNAVAGQGALPCARFAFTMQPTWHEQSKWVIWLMVMIMIKKET